MFTDRYRTSLRHIIKYLVSSDVQYSFKSRVIALSLLLCFVGALPAQELQDLKQNLFNLKAPEKLDRCLQIALLHIEKYGGPDSVIHYSKQAIDLAGTLRNTKLKQRSELYLAIGLQQKNQFDTSIVLLKRCLEESKTNNDSLCADIYYQLGIALYRSGDKKASLANFIEAVPLYQKYGNVDGLTLTYCKLSDVLVTDSQNKEAEDYLNKAKLLLPKLKTPYAKILARNWLSRIYMDLRANSSAYIDSSIVMAKQAYALVKEHSYFTRAFQILNIISDNYFIKEEYETGIQYSKEGLTYRQSLYPGELILSYVKFSDYYGIKGNFEMALRYLDSAKFQLPKINVQYYWLNYYQRSYDLNKRSGKFSEALYAIEHYNSIKDSLYNVDKSKEINELVQKYERVENEKKISELSNEKKIAEANSKFLIAGIIATIFAIIVIVFFYRQTVIRSKLKSIETEQRLNRARMDPHFFFNILSSLRAHTLSEKDPIKTADYLTKYSKIMRQSLESSYNELITIETELDFLNNYFEIQKLRYPDKFNYRIEIVDDIDPSELLLPSMIIQPFVENAIEHGFKNIDHPGDLLVKLETVGKELKITIKDNGEVANNSNTQKAYPSRATQIVKDRLFLLNRQYRSNARFDISVNTGNGSVVTIFLPVISAA